MKRSDIPSIGALRAFVAAAQHGSFTRAASELNVSQGAVSRQIRELEGHLEIRLFERIRQRVVLTEAGKLYLSRVKKPLDEIARASQQVMFPEATTLNLAALPTFATRWLVPRLPSFQRKNPKVLIHLTSPRSAADFAIERFDVAVFHSPLSIPGMVARHLLDVELVVACSPRLNAKHAVRTPGDLSDFPLLHLTGRPNRWAEWMAEAGVTPACRLHGHTYQNYAMLAQAALDGLGIALLPRYLIEKALMDGDLEIMGSRLRFPEMRISYHFIVAEERASLEVVQTFAVWLIAEARKWNASENAKHGADPWRSLRIPQPDIAPGLTD